MIRVRLLAGLLALALTAPAAAAGAAPARSPLVVLRTGQPARVAPAWSARAVMTVAGRRPLTGVRTVLPVLGRTVRRGKAWVRVALPGRPNGSSGWMVAAHTSPASTPWRLLVDLSSRRVTVFELGRVVRRFTAIVGKPSTPTPRGRFFVEEAMALDPGAPGGPFALATSGRSDVLQEFDGGPGQIALHGTHYLPGALGTAGSHGCVRLSDRAITWLAGRIGAGVPLTIRG